MTYVPTNWVTGDVITAQKLNNMETGISASEEIFSIDITATEDAETHIVSYATTKTYADILAAINAGKVLDVTDNNGVSYTVSDITTSESGFVVKCSYSGTEFSGGACTLTVTTLTITGTASTSTVAITASTGTNAGGGSVSDLFEIPVTLTYDEQSSEYTATTTKTYAEIQTAIEAKKLIYFSYVVPVGDDVPCFAYACSCASDENGIMVYATNHTILNRGALLVSDDISLDGLAGEFSITFFEYNSTLTPST